MKPENDKTLGLVVALSIGCLVFQGVNHWQETQTLQSKIDLLETQKQAVERELELKSTQLESFQDGVVYSNR